MIVLGIVAFVMIALLVLLVIPFVCACVVLADLEDYMREKENSEVD